MTSRKGSALLGTIALIVALLFTGIYGFACISANYEYETHIGASWSLSVKASNLQQKSAYLDAFLDSLAAAHLEGHNAAIWRTPDNDVANNIQALRSLQTRMHDLLRSDPTSMAYQQAMGQITAQEQGEAGEVLDVIVGVWYRDHHPWQWNYKQAIVLVLIGLSWCIVFVGYAIEQ